MEATFNSFSTLKDVGCGMDLRSLVFLSVCTFSLVACGGGDDDPVVNPGPATPTTPDLLGTYVGSISSTVSNCPGDVPDGSVFDGSVELNITSQNGNSVSGDATVLRNVLLDPLVGYEEWKTLASVTGSVDASGNLSFNFADEFFVDTAAAGTASGTFSGKLSGLAMNLTGSGKDDAPGTCETSDTITLAKPAAGVNGGSLSVSNTLCENQPGDSQLDAGVATRRRSENSNPVPLLATVTSRKDSTGGDVTVSYMLHEPLVPADAKALVVLLAGGNGNAALVADAMDATKVASAGGNFLVRSADLFADAGYRVVTLDRPSDWEVYIEDLANIQGWHSDDYRVSMQHAVDISAVVNAVNNTNLPVIISGTSRGTISAVPNYMLASGVALSSALTSGAGTPVGAENSPANLQPGYLKVPTHISWHNGDLCSVTTPLDSVLLTGQLFASGLDVVADVMNGGFADPTQTNPCKANTLHGFMGIETCAVNRQNTWIETLATALAGNTRPVAGAYTYGQNVTQGAAVVTIDLAAAAVAMDGDGDTLTYALPYAKSALGGDISVTAVGVLSYTPPQNVGSLVTTDTLVYVVDDGKKGTAHNLVQIPLVPPAAAPRLGTTNIDLINDEFVTLCSGCHAVGQVAGTFEMLAVDWAMLDAQQQSQQRLYFEQQVNFADKLASKIVTKPTQIVTHDGGQKFTVNDPIYNQLVGWLNSSP